MENKEGEGKIRNLSKDKMKRQRRGGREEGNEGNEDGVETRKTERVIQFDKNSVWLHTVTGSVLQMQ